jgi:Cu(I)/Ag(I) efflux system membrane fusion protein/cobalt-zinc-cadmium efflux system membrane fusion protein
MNSSSSHWVTFLFAFIMGATLPLILVWNPLEWEWADAMVGSISGGRAGGTRPAGEEQLWTCGMHPQVLQKEPGICPICNMDLVPVRGSGSDPDPEEKRKIKHWVAPMDPSYISDEPGKSPMGMDLVPVYEEEPAEKTGVRVDSHFLQNFAFRKTTVEVGSIPIEIRTVGILAYNQKNIVSINTKFEGWIEKAKVNYIGESVRRGDLLFEIFSPKLVTTQQEYLAALDYLERLSAGSDRASVRRAESLLAATRERLRYWDVTERQIEQLRTGRTLSRTLEIVSPVSGIVIEKLGDSLEGVKLNPGTIVYKIADLSTIWAEIEVFEYQIQYLREGQGASIYLDAFPNRKWSGTIAYLDPTLNQRTRTLKAYVEIENPERKLRPEMFARVEIEVPAVSGVVVVPEEAILHSGERSVVVVAKEEGLFEPRQVELGPQGGGFRAVLSGLVAGEQVVTSSQFLIDSESNLQEAIHKMLAAQQAGEPSQPPEH